ncbi:MAG: 23S rRNA (adenine(2503)-C(2))-methyltransferase RlmN, partial [Clostridiales bacterium]|nr:23S rRNA (adenine(2503)-C(2))-methyltransferase RlmN [Clostridiales bacterium]
GINDGREHAIALAALLRGLPCHVNLIRLNAVKEKGLPSATADSVKDFLSILENAKISSTLRRTMGADIEGACGQLRRRYIDEVKRHEEYGN